MKRRLVILAILGTVYVISYLVFRNAHIEVWEKDGRRYVIFPIELTWAYYLYRPMTYLDSQLTEMRFHIGPHQ